MIFIDKFLQSYFSDYLSMQENRQYRSAVPCTVARLGEIIRLLLHSQSNAKASLNVLYFIGKLKGTVFECILLGNQYDMIHKTNTLLGT